MATKPSATTQTNRKKPNPSSILAKNLSTVSKGDTRFYTASGADYSFGMFTNNTLLIVPTKTIEINSLGVNLKITYNSTQEPIVISNQYSQLFGVIAIIDAPAPKTTPNVPEYPIATIILLLIVIPLIAYLGIRRIKVKAHTLNRINFKNKIFQFIYFQKRREWFRSHPPLGERSTPGSKIC